MKLGMLACATMLLFPLLSTGQEREKTSSLDEFEAFCQHAACQRNVVVELREPGESVYKKTFDLMPPSVQPMMLTLFPGQSIEAAASFKDGQFTGWRPVAEAGPDDVRMSFRFSQDEKAPHPMLLMIVNKGSKNIKLDLGQMRPQDEDPMRTSSCPVLAGKGDVEFWPYPIVELLVGTPKLVDVSNSITCD
jgi:hypothetical protein